MMIINCSKNRELDILKFCEFLDVKMLLCVYVGGKQLGIYHKNSDEDYSFLFSPKRETELNTNDVFLKSEKFDLTARHFLNHLDTYMNFVLENQGVRIWDANIVHNQFLIYVYMMSPVLCADSDRWEKIRGKLCEMFSPVCGLAFHLQKASTNWNEAKRGMREINVRRLLFTIRNILSLLWIDKNQTPPPTEIEKLFQESYGDVEEYIIGLINRYKKHDDNQLTITENTKISEWIMKNIFEHKNMLKEVSEIDINRKEIRQAYKNIIQLLRTE